VKISFNLAYFKARCKRTISTLYCMLEHLLVMRF